METLHVLKNAEDQITVEITKGIRGGYHVSLKDEDSGEYLGMMKIFPDEQSAIQYAEKATIY